MKKDLKSTILKNLKDYNICVHSIIESKDEIISINCNNYIINIISNAININFHVNCNPLDAARIIQIVSRIKNIDISIGYVYTITLNGKFLVNKRAIEYADQLKYEELSDQFVKDHFERKFLLTHHAGSC